jgi:hypothetical protein
MAKRTAEFDVHPAVAMVATWAAGLPTKSGRTLDQWADHLRAEAPAGPRKGQVAWLKATHGLGTNSADFLWLYTFDRPTWDGDPAHYLAVAPGYVADQYAGPKAALRPILDAILAAGRTLGRDVKVCPYKTMVPLYRGRSFAEVKPATRTRVDLSLALGEFAETDRLKWNPTRLKAGDRLAHVVRLGSPADVDAEVRGWLRTAYETGG